MVTASAIASVYLLMRARRERSLGAWLAAGALLGLTVLIRITLPAIRRSSSRLDCSSSVKALPGKG